MVGSTIAGDYSISILALVTKPLKPIKLQETLVPAFDTRAIAPADRLCHASRLL
jgi:hypothetical protein